MQHLVICQNIDSEMLMHVFNSSKTQNLCDEAVEKDSKMLKLFVTTLKLRKFVKKLFKNFVSNDPSP